MTLPDDPGLPGMESDLDGPAHRGDPLAEQRAMARSAAVVDRSQRGVLAVSGPDRLSWLHLLLTQHVSELPADTGTETLILDANGRVLHHLVLAHRGDTVYLDTEPGQVPAVLGRTGGIRRRRRRLAGVEHYFLIYTLCTKPRSLMCLATQNEGGTGVDTDPTATVSTTHLQERGALAAFARGLAENLTL